MSIKLNRPARYAGTHELAEGYIERFGEQDEEMVEDFAEWLAQHGKLGACTLGITLDMTVRQLVERYVATALGREALKDWAQELAEAELEP